MEKPDGEIALLDVVRNAKPSVLIGVSGQPGPSPKKQCVKWQSIMTRPVIFPLSNPTSRSEATAQDLMDWTEGRALIGTGSPFEPVNVGGKKVRITQTNNSYIFPGLALGIIASQSQARHRHDGQGRRSRNWFVTCPHRRTRRQAFFRHFRMRVGSVV